MSTPTFYVPHEKHLLETHASNILYVRKWSQVFDTQKLDYKTKEDLKFDWATKFFSYEVDRSCLNPAELQDLAYSRMNEEGDLCYHMKDGSYYKEAEVTMGMKTLSLFSKTGERLSSEKRAVPSKIQDSVNLFRIWEKSSYRLEVDDVVYDRTLPPMQISKGVFNAFRGFAVEPKKGKYRCFDRLFTEAICDNDDEKMKFLWNWMVGWLKHPHVTGCAPVFISPERETGKNSFAKYLARLFKDDPLKKEEEDPREVLLEYSTLKKLMDDSRATLFKKAALVVISECKGGGKEQEEWLKGFLSSTEYEENEKFIKAKRVPKRFGIILCSNHENAVRASSGERRYACFLVSPVLVGEKNRDFWNDFYKEMRDPQALGALLYDLQNSTFDESLYRNPFRTEQAKEMFAANMGSAEKFVRKVISEGNLTPSCVGESFKSGTEISRSKLIEEYETFCNNFKESPVHYQLFWRSFKKYIHCKDFQKTGGVRWLEIQSSVEDSRDRFEADFGVGEA